jgi:hypothetical protein
MLWFFFLVKDMLNIKQIGSCRMLELLFNPENLQPDDAVSTFLRDISKLPSDYLVSTGRWNSSYSVL